MIKVDDLIRALEAKADEAFDECEEHTIRGCVEIVKRMPTVDAVEVVRCKDCEYYENSECANPYIWMSDGAHMYTQSNDFCSYGKRREENAAD